MIDREWTDNQFEKLGKWYDEICNKKELQRYDMPIFVIISIAGKEFVIASCYGEQLDLTEV